MRTESRVTINRSSQFGVMAWAQILFIIASYGLMAAIFIAASN